MKNITVIGDYITLNEDQKARLAAIGNVSYVATPEGGSIEWLEAVQGADIICSDGDYLYENLDNLKNVFALYPYIELGNFNSEKLAEKGVYVANTQGSNKNSIAEWAMFSMLSLFRKFYPAVNTEIEIPLTFNESLEDKKVLIAGKGSIGTRIGELCEVFGMKVDFLNRGDDLLEKSKDADVVVNALNVNSTSKNLLDEEFFMALKKGAYFVSFARQHTFDLGGAVKSLDAGILGGAAFDCDPEKPGGVDNEFYQAGLRHEKILATPHIAFATTKAKANGAEFLVQNVENYLAGKCENIIEK